MLIGRNVTNCVEIHDYVQLSFGDQVGLSIYNKMALVPSTARVTELIGEAITSISTTKEAITISFNNGYKLTVDMSEKGYVGPEALQLNRRGRPPVVWN